MKISWGWGQITDPLIWRGIPRHLKAKLMAAHDRGEGVYITRHDCDSIPIRTWRIVAGRLGLSWN